jgi:hypothetical protein
MHKMLVVLNDGRHLTVTGFADTEEMVRFSSAIDSGVFDFNNITFEPVEAQAETATRETFDQWSERVCTPLK